MLCWILNLLSHGLCLCPGPRTHLFQRPASLLGSCFPCSAGRDRCPSRAGSLLPARLPGIQANRVKASYSSHPRAGGNKPAACGALAPICHPLHLALALSFSTVWYLSFPWLLQLGTGLDVGIPCFGSGLWRYSQDCQHTSLLPSFF